MYRNLSKNDLKLTHRLTAWLSQEIAARLGPEPMYDAAQTNFEPDFLRWFCGHFVDNGSANGHWHDAPRDDWDLNLACGVDLKLAVI